MYEAKILDYVGNLIDCLYANTIEELAKSIKANKCIGDQVIVPTAYANDVLNVLADLAR